MPGDPSTNDRHESTDEAPGRSDARRSSTSNRRTVLKGIAGASAAVASLGTAGCVTTADPKLVDAKSGSNSQSYSGSNGPTASNTSNSPSNTASGSRSASGSASNSGSNAQMFGAGSSADRLL